jgi:hypothetical protein
VEIFLRRSSFPTCGDILKEVKLSPCGDIGIRRIPMEVKLSPCGDIGMRRIPMEAKQHIIWRYFTKGMDYSCGNCFIIKARYFSQIRFYGGAENVYKENKPSYF